MLPIWPKSIIAINTDNLSAYIDSYWLGGNEDAFNIFRNIYVSNPLIFLIAPDNQTKIGHYHGCWCPGSLHCQIIRHRGIDNVGEMIPSHSKGRISTACSISILKWKCTHLMLPQNSTTHKGLNIGGCFNRKFLSYHYRNSHFGDKMVLQPSHLHIVIYYTGKTVSYVWEFPLWW